MQSDITIIDDTGLALGPTLWDRVAMRWHRGLEQKSERTRAEYERWVRHYLESIGGDPEAATSSNLHAFAYSSSADDTPPSPSTITVRLAAVRSFYEAARKEGAVPHNPADDVERPKARTASPKGLTAEQLRALLHATPQTPGGARDRAIILTAVFTGLRRAELFALTPGSLENEGGIVFYTVRTKGGDERKRELPDPAMQAIEFALQEQGTPLEHMGDDDPLFAIKSNSFYGNLARYARKAGLKDVTPHVLRHTAAKLRDRTGQSVTDIQAFLGHRSLDTTSRYLARLTEQRDTGWMAVSAMIGTES